jgi:Tol biopolymer transport system component
MICAYLIVLALVQSNEMIAFYSEPGGTADIYVMNPDGSKLTRLTDDPAHDLCPSWSPDGTRIAFTSQRDGDQEIYTMDPDGTNLKRLTFSPGAEYHMDWSPDGTRIAFTSERDGNQEIYVMDASDGGNLIRLTNNTAGDMRPDWTADSQYIIFNSDRNGNWDIWRMDADGGNQTAMTTTPGGEVFPRLSPDNTKITYFSFPNGGDIYVWDLSTGQIDQLTFNPAVDEDPVWTADGQRIVFQSSRDNNFEIYIMDADGGNQTRLTNNSCGDYWPDCSPRMEALYSDKQELPASSGTSIDITLTAGLENSGRNYLLLAGASGTVPGFTLPGGTAVLPLNWDPLTDAALLFLNTSLFQDFLGSLGITGYGKAHLNAGPLAPVHVGVKLHLGFCLNNPFDFASNALEIEIVP